MAQASNSLLANTDVSSRLDSILAGVTGHNASGSLVIDGKRIELSPRGAWILTILISATPEDVDQVEQLLTRADAPDEVDMVSPESAAAMLGVSRPTVIRWASEGQIATYKVGTHHRYARRDIGNLRNSRRKTASAARLAALAQREQLVAKGADLDIEPTSAELIAAGRALQENRPGDAVRTLARARRADVNAAVLATVLPETAL
jgi:excisionase family DNA binding protein